MFHYQKREKTEHSAERARREKELSPVSLSRHRPPSATVRPPASPRVWLIRTFNLSFGRFCSYLIWDVGFVVENDWIIYLGNLKGIHVGVFLHFLQSVWFLIFIHVCRFCLFFFSDGSGCPVNMSFSRLCRRTSFLPYLTNSQHTYPESRYFFFYETNIWT